MEKASEVPGGDRIWDTHASMHTPELQIDTKGSSRRIYQDYGRFDGGEFRG